MLKKTRTSAGEVKRKSILEKQFKLKLSNIYSETIKTQFRKTVKYNPQEERCQLHKQYCKKILNK